MILLGCLLAFGLSVAPRLFLVLAWFFSERWQVVWQGEFLVPLLGIILLPYTTIMYMLVWTVNGIEGWDWMWIGLGLLLDFWKWQQVIQNRETAMQTGRQVYKPTTADDLAGTSKSSVSASAAASAASTTPAASATPAASGAVADDSDAAVPGGAPPSG